MPPTIVRVTVKEARESTDSHARHAAGLHQRATAADQKGVGKQTGKRGKVKIVHAKH